MEREGGRGQDGLSLAYRIAYRVARAYSAQQWLLSGQARRTGMLVKAVHTLDYRLVIATVMWFVTTAWIADDIATSLHGLAVAFIRAAASPSLLTGF